MKNLAGVDDCDRYIRDELTRARIPIVDGQKSTGEVPYTLTGKLGDIVFRRAWYYWVADGPVPLALALELYADPVGKTDVRVDGHCGCPPPEHPWVARYDSAGKRIALDVGETERAQFRGLISGGHLTQEQFDAHRWVDSDAERDAVSARAVVETYHIDTEVGLRLFADVVSRPERTRP